MDVVADCLALTPELKKCVEFLGQRRNTAVVLDGFFETFAVLHHLLALFWIVPEFG